MQSCYHLLLTSEFVLSKPLFGVCYELCNFSGFQSKFWATNLPLAGQTLTWPSSHTCPSGAMVQGMKVTVFDVNLQGMMYGCGLMSPRTEIGQPGVHTQILGPSHAQARTQSILIGLL